MQDILSINAHLKYIEFLLYSFDHGDEDKTMGELKKEFQTKFNTMQPLLNQHFGVCRLLPLILMKETYKNQKAELAGDVATIKIIRDAIVHHDFSFSEKGYVFKNSKESISLSYSEFNEFLHKIENEFCVNNCS